MKHNKNCQIGDNWKDCPACKELSILKPIKKPPNPLEKVIEKKVCDHAKSLGCRVYKFTSPNRRSVPDRLFIMPQGKGVFFIEFKRRGEKPTEAQAMEIAAIQKQGTAVFVVDNVEYGKDLISGLMNALTLNDPFFN